MLTACTTDPTLRPLEKPPEAVAQVVAKLNAEGVTGPQAPPSTGLGICMSGGGYRATLFSLGAVAALNDMGLLRQATVIGGVSGGAITAANLVQSWPQIYEALAKGQSLLETQFAQELLELTDHTIDIPAVLEGFLPGIQAPGVIANNLDRRVYGHADVRSVITPDRPALVILATAMRTNRVFDTTELTLGLAPVGYYDLGAVRLADAVAASAAFPPIFAPYVWKYQDINYDEPLEDGGVADNMGLFACKGSAKSIVIDARAIDNAAARPRYRTWWGALRGTINVMHAAFQNDSLAASLLSLRGPEDRSVDALLTEIYTSPDHLSRGDYYVSLDPRDRPWLWQVNFPRDVGASMIRAELVARMPSPGSRQISTPEAFKNLMRRTDKLCISPPTRFKALSRDVRVGLIQWGYISTWAAIDGRLTQRTADIMQLNMAVFEKEVEQGEKVVVEDLQKGVARDLQTIDTLSAVIAQDWKEMAPLRPEGDSRSKIATSDNDKKLLAAQQNVAKIEAVLAIDKPKAPLFTVPIVFDPRYRLPYLNEPSCLSQNIRQP